MSHSAIRNPKSAILVTGPFILGEILKRNAAREKYMRQFRERRARKKIHTARLSDREVIESNLPLRNPVSEIRNST
jgi:hypothetical protein